MIRASILAAAFLSPFLFPAALGLALGAAAALIFPFAGLLLGVLYDALYWVPERGLPLASLLGAAATAAAYAVRRFAATRMMF